MGLNKIVNEKDDKNTKFLKKNAEDKKMSLFMVNLKIGVRTRVDLILVP